MPGNGVTPRVGVWIETSSCMAYICGMWSLPAWECGLKLNCSIRESSIVKSLPAWECGLKQNNALKEKKRVVTPRVGVWIETRSIWNSARTPSVTPRVGVWIETIYMGVR